MIADKKMFYGGALSLLVFGVLFIIMFTPVLKGQNALEYLDALYNSISKGSAYYIPLVREESEKFTGKTISVALVMADEKQAVDTARLFEASGAEATVKGAELKISGNLGKILGNCLADADAMYNNDGEKVSGKYGYDERQVLFNWWKSFKGMEKDLKKQKNFEEASIVALVVKKAVESSYNYYRIEPQKITDRLGLVVFSLVFYVGYTLWYGFSIMYMFEGWGLRLEH